MIKAIAAAMACLGMGLAHAAPVEGYLFNGIILSSEMEGVSVGTQFSGMLSLDLRPLGQPSSPNSSSSVWTNESGCSLFIDGACSHAVLDQLPFARIEISVDGRPIATRNLSYHRSQLEQSAGPNQTGYQVSSYTSMSSIVGDPLGGNVSALSESQGMTLSFSSFSQLFDDFHVAEQLNLAVPLSGAFLSYQSTWGSCVGDGFECDPASSLSAVSGFFGEVTSIRLFGQDNDVPEPSGLAWLGLALVGASAVRRSRVLGGKACAQHLGD